MALSPGTKAGRAAVSLILLWSLVEVHSQTAPYVSFMSQTSLANNSYVDISQVGNDLGGSDSVQCRTDLSTCCTVAQGPHRGDWYFPDGTRLNFAGNDGDIYEFRDAQRVDIRRRNNANSPTGIYRCDIPTNAVHHDTDASVRDAPVYVGLYTTSGGTVSISGEVAFDSDQLTLTCISTGGPATTVTWTRDSTTVTQGTQTVLNDPVTAQYTHTLTLTTAGNYTCTVANNKPSSDSASTIVTGPDAPTAVTAVQDGPTSILVSWSPSSDATGYTISYTGGGSGSETVSGGDTNSYNLTGLTNGQTYTISIVATSNNLASDTVTAMAVGLVPGQPNATTGSTTATTVSLSWSVPSGSVVDEYLIEWTRNTSVGCSDEDTGSTTITATSHTLPDLEEDSRYTITVTASNGAGSGEVSNTVTAMTGEAAPSAPPSPVNAMVESSTSIAVQWGEVPCIHQNGVITGYSVQYEVNGSSDTETMPVSGASTTQTPISGLMSSTTYSIRVAAVNNQLIGTYSSAENQLTEVAVPVLTVDSTTATSISLSWTSAGSEGVMYEVNWQRNTSVGCTDEDTGSTTITGGSMTSYNITGLEEDSRYIINMTAYNSLGNERSEPVTAMTMIAPSAPPSSVNAMVESSASITVQWGEVPCIHQNGAIIGYSVQYGVMGSGNTETMPVSGASTTQTTLSDLNPSTTYSIRVAAVNNQLIGTYSSAENELTEVAVPVLVSDSTTATSISLSWTSGGSEGVSYEVEWERDTSVGCTDEDTNSTTITGGSMTSYTITGLEEDSRYAVTVNASNTLGDEPSNQITAMTMVARPTAAPMSVTSSSTSSSTITVQWGVLPCADQNGAITGYSVQYGVMGSGNTQMLTVNGADMTQTTIENLMSSTTYSIEVAAVNSAGTGVYSTPRNQLTRVEAPVVAVVESSVTATSIPVTWSSGGSEGVSYVVEWAYGGGCPGISGGSQNIGVGGGIEYTIEGLQEYITYSITVRANNSLSSVDSTAVDRRTGEARPSASPIDVTADGASTTITVQWGSVPCIHQNGQITSYSIWYGVEGSGNTQTLISTGNVAEITELVTSTNYTVQVAAITSAGVGEYSDPPLIVNTETAITLTIAAATTNSILIQWNVMEEAQGSIMPSGYNISYRNTEYTDCFTKFNTISIPTNSLGGNYSIVGLEEGTDYSITVALLMDGAVTDRNTILQATAEAAPSAPPSEVMVASVTSSNITVVWGEVPCDDQNGDITGYSVQYEVMGSGSTESMAVDGDSDGGMATISGLEAATMYEYQVAGTTSAGPGEYSTPMTTLTSVIAPIVPEPSIGPFSISISWTSSGPVVERYEVEWQRDTSGVCPDEHMDRATVSGGSVRSYDITDLFGDSSYSIRVSATNAAGSAISDPLVLSTAEAAPTAPPASLSSSSVTPSSFSIQWGRVPCIHRNGDITGYSVLVQGNGSMRSIDVNDRDVLTTDVSGLVSDTMYLVRVAGANGQGIGVYRGLPVTTPQTVYLNFGGMNLPTNGLVNISQLGNSTDTGLVCSTDQSADGTLGGGWSNPDGTMLTTSSSEGFFVSDGSDGVYLLRGSGIPVEGIYTCSATDSSGNSRTVFVGLYNEQGGEVGIDGEIGFTLVSELTAEEPQFTLSCNSTDGPATSVIWTRESDTVGEGTTVLNDAVTAHYTHTLTVAGRLGGVYVCTVSNSISTTASRGQNIEVASAPTNLMLIQTDATTIRVTWTPPSPLGNTIGYTVFYSSTGSNEAPVVREASTNEVELMNLAEGGSYSISLVARSQHLPSPTLTDTLDLVRVPRDLELSVADTTGTSITVSWTVAGGQVESYDIVWGTGLSTEVSGEEESYTIEGLEEGESYTISITASNAAGSTSDDITASTTPAEASSLAVAAGAAGGGAAVAVVLVVVVFIIFCVLCCRRRTKQKYDPRNLDGTMFKNHSLPTSYSQGTVEVLSKSTEADDVELVSNRNGVEETAIYDNLIVPKIEEFPEELEVMEGERVAFGVRVTGTPDPKLIWYHNGVEVVPDYSRELAEDGTLSMPSAETKHSGVYQLVAHNPGGRAEREVRLTVREEEEEKKRVSTTPDFPPTTGIVVPFFGNFVEQCHSNQNQAFQDQYQGLYNGDEKSTTIAINPDNKPKNRFLNICVYDDHRVTLRPLEGHKDCQTDYINGSYVDGYSQPGKFLATQGPLPVTVVDFWRLVWQERVPTIVMITNLVEGTKIKCHQYWPDKDSARFGPFEVSLIDQQTLADYTVRTLIVQLVGSSRSSLRVTHFHFTAWPDHGVPDYATPILTFHKRVVKEHPTGKGPIMVHCSAGVGRTGTFITIDHVLEQVGKENVVDIPGVINKIRHQRMKLVQTVDQYIFIHDAILESVTCGDTQIASSDLRRAIQQMGDKGFAHQFAVLEQVSPRPDEVTAKFAARNPDRNRSQEFLPADKWRVALRGDHPDYINAVFINGYKQQRAFIIAQSPMQSTARDFWKMVYDRKCGVLVMLCDLVESGKETCYQYWPSSGSLTFGEFKVDLLGEELMDNSVLKTLSVTHTETGKSHQVSQFHITNWAPDGSCWKLNSVSSVVEEMTKIQRRTGNHTITVHCSDTVSRSGMFCAIATTIERCKTEGVVDVFQVVKALRVQKPGAVRTVMQYKTIFEAVLVFLDSFDTYANF